MFKKLLHGLNKRKVKIFSLFLLCSFLAWFLSNLSESYESRANFAINYRNLPDTLLLGKNSENILEAKLRTSGFQFLYFNFFKKRIDLDVSQVIYQDGKYVLTEAVLKKQIEQQLSQNISLMDVGQGQLDVDLYQVVSREVHIRADLSLQFQQNYILDGELEISPTHVVVKGPGNEVDTLKSIVTGPIQLANLSADFSREVPLIFPRGLDNTIFSVGRVNVSGKVVRFSEKVFEVPVQVVNLPEGFQVKTFPSVVTVLCKATVDRLKELSLNDFGVTADYGQLNGSDRNTLFLRLSKSPESVYDVKLQEPSVNFVLEQE